MIVGFIFDINGEHWRSAYQLKEQRAFRSVKAPTYVADAEHGDITTTRKFPTLEMVPVGLKWSLLPEISYT